MTPVTVPTANRNWVYGDTGFSVDKCLKIDEPLETIYLSHNPRPMKVLNTALSETMKADEIASETLKTEKVTAVVVVMSIFKKKRCKLRSTNLGNERLGTSLCH